jgi:hypothetical protein
MTKQEVIRLIKKMQPQGSVVVESQKERVLFLQVAKTLWDAGVIKFRCRSWRNRQGGFTIIAKD